MRKIESNIINLIEFGFSRKVLKLSIRDKLENRYRIIKYYLWGTCLFTLDEASGKMRIFTSSFSEKMSNTTISRLNAILCYFGYFKLSRKGMKLFYGSEEVKTDKWFILGTNRRLIAE